MTRLSDSKSSLLPGTDTPESQNPASPPSPNWVDETLDYLQDLKARAHDLSSQQRERLSKILYDLSTALYTMPPRDALPSEPPSVSSLPTLPSLKSATRSDLRNHLFQLRESERRFMQAVDNYPGVFVIYDAERRVQFVNMHGLNLVHRSLEDLIGHTDEEIYPPEFTGAYLPLLKQTIETCRIQNAECVLNFDDESLLFDVTYVPLFNEQGELQQILGITYNITERKQLEDAIQDALNYAESIIDTTHEPLVVLDENLRITDANKAFLGIFQVDREEILNRKIYELGNGQWNASGLRAHLEQLLANHTEIRNLEVDYKDPRNGQRSYLINARLLTHSRSPDHMILLAVEDVTIRKQTQQALEQYTHELTRSNADLEQFAYVASHDLQEPLRIIVSYLQLLEQRYGNRLDEDADDFIDYAIDGANRLQILIRDLLMYAQLDDISEPFETVDCQSVLDQATNNLAPAITASGAIITHDPMPAITANQTQLVQLFQNLLDNAIKFHGEAKPRIHIGAQAYPNGWLFSIRDNGIGFDPQYAEQIFVLFRRLHSKVTYAGTGIGLAICKKVVEWHGGRIWVKSEYGKGSTFYFIIPSNLPISQIRTSE